MASVAAKSLLLAVTTLCTSQHDQNCFYSHFCTQSVFGYILTTLPSNPTFYYPPASHPN